MPCFAQPPRASDAMLPQPWNLNGGFVRRVSAHEFPTVTIEGPESVLGSSSLHAAGQSNERAPKAIRSSKKGFEPYHARAVPKSADLKSAARDASTEQVLVTTIMLRNIPNKYSQSTMLEEIDDEGFAGTYDFFYLPMDVQNRSNVGYAFINFTTPEHASRFFVAFSEYQFRRYHSRKVSKISAAHVQGLDANLRHFANRAVTHARNGQYRPVVLRGSERVNFDEAVAQVLARGARDAPVVPPAKMEAARQGFEDALRGYLVRQISEESNSTASSTGLGLHGIFAGRTSMPAGCAPPSPPDSEQGAWLPGGEQRSSEDPVSDSPAYIPLPTIPSASKIFAACHEEAADGLEDAFGPWLVGAGAEVFEL